MGVLSFLHGIPIRIVVSETTITSCKDSDARTLCGIGFSSIEKKDAIQSLTEYVQWKEIGGYESIKKS